jgi:hypothetical protein
MRGITTAAMNSNYPPFPVFKNQTSRVAPSGVILADCTAFVSLCCQPRITNQKVNCFTF